MGCICARSAESVVNALPPSAAATLCTEPDEKKSSDRRRVAIVTGPTTGIGKQTAKFLFSLGFEVVLAGRSEERLKSTAEAISLAYPQLDKTKLHVLVLDTSSLESVRAFVDRFLSLGLPLHLLINNAGIMAAPFTLTRDGFELQLQTNHLGHFLLTELLLPKMKETAATAPAGSVRVVIVSSAAHRGAKALDPDHLNWQEKDYSPFLAYARSKLCNVLHARALAERLQGSGVTAYSLHPGVIPTDLGRNNCCVNCFYLLLGCCMLNTSQGSATTLYCALEPGLEVYSGRYFSDVRLATASPLGEDAQLAMRLYDVSLQLVGIRVTAAGADRTISNDPAAPVKSEEDQNLLINH
jgi:WW domain-containing oxidoreductase